MKLWKLELIDGTSIEMPEGAATLAKAALTGGSKFIELPDRTVATHQIKSLDKTAKEDTTGKKLLNEGLNAFKGKLNEYKKDGYSMIVAVRVKKQVGQREYSSYYSKHPSYKTEPGEGFWVSFWVAKDLGIPEGCEIV